MATMLHGSARTTPRIRAELQRSQEKTSVLAQRYGLSRTTVTKWRTRTTTSDAPMGPAKPKSTVLSPAEEAVIVEFRRRTLLPLDDVMGCLRESIPKLSRSSLHRCLQRHGISRLPGSEIKTTGMVVPGPAQASTMRARSAKLWAVQRRLVQLCKVARSTSGKVSDTARGLAMMASCRQGSQKYAPLAPVQANLWFTPLGQKIANKDCEPSPQAVRIF